MHQGNLFDDGNKTMNPGLRPLLFFVHRGICLLNFPSTDETKGQLKGVVIIFHARD